MFKKTVLEAMFMAGKDDEPWGVSFSHDYRPDIEMAIIIGNQRRTISVDADFVRGFAQELLDEFPEQ